jgi:putative glutathione S-transferase
MGMLVEGKWQAEETPLTDAKGTFNRHVSKFREHIAKDGRFPPERGRYHLFVAYGCPWAHRTILYRRLKGLEDVIDASFSIGMRREGWAFDRGAEGAKSEAIQPIDGLLPLHRVYTAGDPAYTGRITVPVLWDTRTGSIVNNESSEIIRMLDWEFDALGAKAPHYYLPERAAEIDALNERIYRRLNNGVYRAGFAKSQAAYDEAVHDVFAQLDELDERLGGSRFLLGDRPLEPDWRLFPTLLRFDVAYHYAFKCNLRKIDDYPNLSGYLRELYQWPGVRETVLPLTEYKRGYFSIPPVNPSGVVPIGPMVDLDRPHGRGRIGGPRVD